MKRYLLLITMVISINCIGQFVEPEEMEKIKFKCKQLAYINSDWGKNKQTDDSISVKYSIEEIHARRVGLILFFKLTQVGSECQYYCAYNVSEGSIYRLSGFSVNDFEVFWYYFLMEGIEYPRMKNYKTRTKLKYALTQVKVDGLDFAKLYSLYQKDKKRFKDIYNFSNSCMKRIMVH